jgi:hypothetical protein
MRRQREGIALKPWWLVGLIAIQVVFIVAGLAITFWTINEWDSDQPLDALFGAGLGAYAFLFTWTLMRRWVREHADVWRKPSKT